MFNKYIPIFALALALFAQPALAINAVIVGPDGTPANVDSDNQLQTKSIVETQLEGTSSSVGQAFTWTSTFVANSGEEAITIRNDSATLNLHFDQIWIGCADLCVGVAGHMTSGTPAGTTITGEPLNHDLSRVADATSFGNAAVTGTVVTDTMMHFQAPADQTMLFDLEGAWIFGKDDVFVIRPDTGTTVYITVIGHFRAIE